MSKKKTKLGELLEKEGITQTDLHYLILHKSKKSIGMDRISRMVNGVKNNYTIDTAKAIARALDVSINDIIDED